ncbi:hypothetical protein CSUB01_11276 [Colletotrichum sublineola]|uniref:Uncharacterized protein n=1 Tax=Colletotrichum sublineola TaxID=1173701 RepID=A0A066XAN5_COLSU|nr:hypothetical protein CSUB01_11276 [Colletotrichum sublineola]
MYLPVGTYAAVHSERTRNMAKRTLNSPLPLLSPPTPPPFGNHVPPTTKPPPQSPTYQLQGMHFRSIDLVRLVGPRSPRIPIGAPNVPSKPIQARPGSTCVATPAL